MLPLEKQNRIARLLPPTAFRTYKPQVDPSHPSYQPQNGDSSSNDSMDVDTDPTNLAEQLVPGFVNCQFLQAAAKQYQVRFSLIQFPDAFLEY